MDAEGFRQAEILKAEGEKQAIVLDAEGRKEAAYRDAEARERLAEAEAQAPPPWYRRPLLRETCRPSTTFVAQKYVGALTDFANSPNQKTLLLPMETTGILGSLAGITEIAKAVMSDKATGEYLTMTGWLEHIVFWHWWILAGLLLILELTAPCVLLPLARVLLPEP